jgi:hypothetical protein
VEISTSISYGYPKPYNTCEKGRLEVHNIPVSDTRQLRNKWTNEVGSAFERWKSILRHNVHLYQFLTRRINSIPVLRTLFVRSGLARRDEFSMPADLLHHQLMDQEQIVDLSEELIRETKRTSENAGAKFLLVFLPNKEYDPAFPAGYSRNVGYGKDAYDIARNFPWNTRSSEYLQRMTKKEGIEFLDLLPVVREAHKRSEHFFYPGDEDHHLGPKGHRLAAEALFKHLHNLAWLQ